MFTVKTSRLTTVIDDFDLEILKFFFSKNQNVDIGRKNRFLTFVDVINLVLKLERRKDHTISRRRVTKFIRNLDKDLQ